ncbi:MAG: BlaI/MecI/CopY family transcriptional regulator [Christensenellales bacterium]|jgi:BlaI family penicillinase repressor
MKISKSEQAVLDILWQESPLTAAQIVERCARSHPWSDKTVKTFLRRLQDKGAVIVQRRDVYHYYPALTKEQAALGKARQVLDDMFDGSYWQMTAQFVNNGELSNEDIRDLRDYLSGLLSKEAKK